MARRPIREYEAKRILHENWATYFPALDYPFQAVSVSDGDALLGLAREQAWLAQTGLVAKPDMVFGKRGKNGLVYFKDSQAGDVDLERAAAWVDARCGENTRLLSGQEGRLSRFLVEPFLAHDAGQEYYISATLGDEEDYLFLSDRGGVDVEENWDRVTRLPIGPGLDQPVIETMIADAVPPGVSDREGFIRFAIGFYFLFRDLHFAYLEINPFVLDGATVHLLDMVAKVDDTAGFLMHRQWGGELYYPTPFGMQAPGPEENAIKAMDEKSGASLKLTLLNPRGRIWTLVAGGGASVVYADTIADLVGVADLANYGEYSGNPTGEETYIYTRTVLDLMTREPDPTGRGKVLIIGGAIANFTNVANTFGGVIRAFHDYHEQMKAVGVRIYVRRGGPNYEIGLKRIEAEAAALGLPIEVHGPETHMTDIVSRSLAA